MSNECIMTNCLPKCEYAIEHKIRFVSKLIPICPYICAFGHLLGYAIPNGSITVLQLREIWRNESLFKYNQKSHACTESN